jgi:hypothetical protein
LSRILSENCDDRQGRSAASGGVAHSPDRPAQFAAFTSPTTFRPAVRGRRCRQRRRLAVSIVRQERRGREVFGEKPDFALVGTHDLRNKKIVCAVISGLDRLARRPESVRGPPRDVLAPAWRPGNPRFLGDVGPRSETYSAERLDASAMQSTRADCSA